MYSFSLHGLKGDENAKHCLPRFESNHLIASSFIRAVGQEKKGLIYVMGADYVNGIIDGDGGWDGRRGHSATLWLGSETRADS